VCKDNTHTHTHTHTHSSEWLEERDACVFVAAGLTEDVQVIRRIECVCVAEAQCVFLSSLDVIMHVGSCLL